MWTGRGGEGGTIGSVANRLLSVVLGFASPAGCLAVFCLVDSLGFGPIQSLQVSKAQAINLA